MLTKFIKKADEKIFAALLWSTQTKAAFYCLLLIIIVATVISPPTSVYLWLMVVVSIGYQGVALPGVGYTSKQAERAANEQGEMTRKLLQEAHDKIMEEFDELGDVMAEMRATHGEIRDLVAQVHVKVGAETVDVTVSE